MKGPHGHDLFMSCISELVLETREVSTVFQKISFFFFSDQNINAKALSEGVDVCVVVQCIVHLSLAQ